MKKLYDSETGCCQEFDPKPWDKKTITWKNKPFLKDHVCSFLHIPLNFGGVMKKNMEKIVKVNALSSEPVVLSDEKSLWGSDIYISVSKPVPDSETTKISGTFLSKVYEGSYSQTGKWVKDMEAFVKSKGRKTKKLYFFYTTCPKCAKHYGKNYVVLLAKI